MPIFNGEAFLEQTLQSLLAQDLADFELIISDNASTDRTFEICQEYARRDVRISLMSNEINRGAAWNYNQVFDLARGKYFKWAAADDLYEPSFLRHCVNRLAASKGRATLAYAQTILIDGEGRKLGRYDDRMALGQSTAHQRVAALARDLQLCNAIFGVMRRDVLAATRRIGRYGSADRVLLAELCMRGEIIEVPAPLFYRRIHEGISMRANSTAKELATWFDPACTQQRFFPRVRVLREIFAACMDAPLPFYQKLRCFHAYWSHWHRTPFRVIAGEIRRGLSGDAVTIAAQNEGEWRNGANLALRGVPRTCR